MSLTGWVLVIVVAVFIWNIFKGYNKGGSSTKRPDYRDQYQGYKKENTQTEKEDDPVFETKDEVFWRVFNSGLLVKRKKWLCNRAEGEYFKNLTEWFDKYFNIHCQVSLGQLFEYSDWTCATESDQKRFATICNSMALDYVLVYKNSVLIYCVIELDGPTHETVLRRERDKRLDALMGRIGIPLLHIPVSCVNEKPDIWKFRNSEKNTV